MHFLAGEHDSPLAALNSLCHLASQRHIANRMRALGVVPLIRCEVVEGRVGLLQVEKTFWALVGGIYHKSGPEAAKKWMFLVLKVQSGMKTDNGMKVESGMKAVSGTVIQESCTFTGENMTSTK